jgi:hypothetical protein
MTADPLAELVEAGDRAIAEAFALLALDVAPAPPRTTVCALCGGPIQVAATGRPAQFCSALCRQRAWWAARAR